MGQRSVVASVLCTLTAGLCGSKGHFKALRRRRSLIIQAPRSSLQHRLGERGRKVRVNDKELEGDKRRGKKGKRCNGRERREEVKLGKGSSYKVRVSASV